MKLSLAWIYDHLEIYIDTVEAKDIILALTERTAEIESVETLSSNLSSLFLGQITAINPDNGVQLYAPELDQTFTLSYRPDVYEGHYVFITLAIGENPLWACMRDFGSSKDSILPLVHVCDYINPRNWRDCIPSCDFIITIDNKSITHRPDLWSHRGFAREIAALYDWKLKPLDQLLTPMEVHKFHGTASPITKSLPTLTIHEKSLCKKIAATSIATTTWSPSRIPIVSRLCRIDSKPIHALIDLTNYVMFDLGQPMHAYDANHIRDNQLNVRHARMNETIKLLDGDTVTLTPDDVVIADSVQPISLAGVMGSVASAVNCNTQSLIVESGCFNASFIRNMVSRCKKRTESAMRYEKNLDPEQTSIAIKRYLYLLNEYNIPHTHDGSLVVIGQKTASETIAIDHSYIEKKLGITIEPSFIIKKLGLLECTVTLEESPDRLTYHCTIPSFRATKDLAIKEDLVEEIGRLFGYHNIPLLLPAKALTAQAQTMIYRERYIKNILSLSLSMHELRSYGFFDESWLKQIQWEPNNAIHVKQPVSKNWERLVTTLVPHLCKAVHDNYIDNKQICFFEYGRIWQKNSTPVEKHSLAGIMYDATGSTCFYDYKAKLDQLFSALSMTVQYKKIHTPPVDWYFFHETAELYVNDVCIGFFGTVNPAWQQSIIPDGYMALFELDGTFLRTYNPPHKTYKEVSKYPAIQRDLSILVPLTVTTHSLESLIKNTNALIQSVTLKGFFQKADWLDKKSLTFNLVIQDRNKTLTGQEIDAIMHHMYQEVMNIGAEIR